MRARTVLSPSSADRWMHCAGSALAVADLRQERKTTSYAELGTAAHELFEIAMRTGEDPNEFIGHTVEANGIVVDEDMADAVAYARDWVVSYIARAKKAGTAPVLRFEDRVEIGPLVGLTAEDCSGTADCTIDNWPECVVFDYKHGAGVPVTADMNKQLRLYAMGMQWRRMRKKLPPYKRFLLVVLQPRSMHDNRGPERLDRFTASELNTWARTFAKPRMHAALDPLADRTAGDWCRWCPVNDQCTALTKHVFAIAKLDFDPMAKKTQSLKDANTLTDTQLTYVLRHKDIIHAWISAVYGAALKRMLRGQKLSGFKLVNGRGSRAWRDQQKAMEILITKVGMKRDDVMPRSPISVAQAETLFTKLKEKGKTQKDRKAVFYKTVGKLIESKKGALHIAPVDDPRAPTTPAKADFT